MIGDFVCKLRLENKLSQSEVADKLGLSRPTYAQIEKNVRELTVSEAKKIANFFNISLYDLLSEDRNEIEVDFDEGEKKNKEREMRISVPQKNIEKFKEVLLYVLSKVGNRPNVGETVVYKLLYFIDFDYYEKFEEQLIGASYIKNHHGPTPLEFKKIVEEMINNKELEIVKSAYFKYMQKKYLPLREADLSKLKNARELQHIDEVLARLADKNAAELSEYSHKDVPWIGAKEGEVIDYEAVFYRGLETSVRDYGEED